MNSDLNDGELSVLGTAFVYGLKGVGFALGPARIMDRMYADNLVDKGLLQHIDEVDGGYCITPATLRGLTAAAKRHQAAAGNN